MNINEDSDIDKKHIANYIVIAVLVAALLALNWCSLKKYLSSNSRVINDFQVSEDEMTNTREPAVAGIFYASELRQLDHDVEHYLSVEIRPGTARPMQVRQQVGQPGDPGPPPGPPWPRRPGPSGGPPARSPGPRR